jgi:hypothetical protein
VIPNLETVSGSSRGGAMTEGGDEHRRPKSQGFRSTYTVLNWGHMASDRRLGSQNDLQQMFSHHRQAQQQRVALAERLRMNASQSTARLLPGNELKSDTHAATIPDLGASSSDGSRAEASKTKRPGFSDDRGLEVTPVSPTTP